MVSHRKNWVRGIYCSIIGISISFLCVYAQQDSFVFVNEISGKTTGISTKLIAKQPYFAFSDLMNHMNWELDLDFAEGIMRAQFRDVEFRFADGVSAYYRSSELIEISSAFYLEGEILWAPQSILLELIIPVWEGDLVWNAVTSELKLMRPPESLSSQGRDSSVSQPIVVIDAGHGGEDLGFILTNGKQEKDLTRKLAEKTSRLLTDRMGADVVLTRNGDFLLSEIDRTMIANRSKCDLFVSIHIVASSEIGSKGFMVYTLLPPQIVPVTNIELIPWNQIDPQILAQGRQYASAFGESLATAAGGVLWEESQVDMKVLQGLSFPAFVAELGTSLAFFGDVAIDKDDGLNRAAEALYDGIHQAIESGGRDGI